MQQIMDATERETVSDTMDSINKIVEDIPYLKIPKEEPQQEELHIETDEEIDGSIKINFQELLGEDSDGQISMVVDDHAMVERQITGQMSIADVLEEWEKTKRAAEAALEDAEQRKLESAKARALQQAGDIMDRLTGVIPKLDAGVTPRELLEEEYLQNAPEGTVEPVVLPEEEAQVEEIPIGEIPVDEAVVGEPLTEEPPEESLPEEAPVSDAPAEEPEAGEPAEEELWPEGMSLEDLVEAQEAKAKPVEDTPKRRHERSPWKGMTARMPQVDVTEPEDLGDESGTEAAKPIVSLTDEQKAIFSYFMPIKGMEEQLCKALSGISARLTAKGTAATGNLIIQGGQGCGKTTLATSVIKVLQKETGCLSGKIGKIKASLLNKKDVGDMLKRVAGGCLIIEQASELTRQTEVTLSLLLEQEASGILVILEDTSKGIRKLLSQDENFAKKFTAQITVPIFTNDELVTFARAYSRELGYKIDDVAVLALYDRISKIQRLDQATTLTQVKEIVDEAIRREANGGFKKMVSILTASRYTDDDRIVLREKDFE
jgi:hypothetical protein